MFPVSSERLPMPSVEVFQWLSSSAIPRVYVCVPQYPFETKQMKRVSCQSLFASVPRGCANYLSFLLQMPGSPNFVGRVASLSPRLPPNMVSQHGDRLAWVLSVHLLDPWYFCRGIRQYPSHVMSALAELSQILTNVSY